MKITIDTERKVISIDEATNISELLSELKRMCPNDWGEYKFNPTVAIEQPCDWQRQTWPTGNKWWWSPEYPFTTYGSSTGGVNN